MHMPIRQSLTQINSAQLRGSRCLGFTLDRPLSCRSKTYEFGSSAQPLWTADPLGPIGLLVWPTTDGGKASTALAHVLQLCRNLIISYCYNQVNAFNLKIITITDRLQLLVYVESPLYMMRICTSMGHCVPTRPKVSCNASHMLLRDDS